MSFWIKNITNNYYAAFVSSGSPQALGSVSWNVAPPRTYGVSIRYNFGG
jgi:outer membrane receptor protein involved in Fe transport